MIWLGFDDGIDSVGASAMIGPYFWFVEPVTADETEEEVIWG